MRHRRTPLALLSAALVALSVAACDKVEQGALQSPTDPQHSLSTLSFGSRSFHPITDVASANVGNLSLSRLIDANGGEIHLFGHSIRVPAGAVSDPTVFTLSVVPNGYVEVDLTAVVTSLSGTTEVGSNGFDKPVRLTLSYARARNVRNASELKVLWVTGSHLKGYQVLGLHHPAVDTNKKTVTTDLHHFSQYMLAEP